MNFPEIQTRCRTVASSKGWEGDTRSFGDHIALFHSELSEALEEYRAGHPISETYYEDDGKPCGIPSELADTIIRIMDFAEFYDINLEEIILKKLEYNTTRAALHGGKKI